VGTPSTAARGEAIAGRITECISLRHLLDPKTEAAMPKLDLTIPADVLTAEKSEVTA